MPVPLVDQDNNPIALPNEEVGAALLSGKYGHPDGPDARIEVTKNGQRGTVRVADLPKELKAGAQLTPESVLQQERQTQSHNAEAAQYGGPMSMLKTLGEQALESGTLGLSNWAYSPEALQEKAKRAEVNPGTALVGKVGGFVGPVAAEIASGGAATPELAAAEGAATAAPTVAGQLGRTALKAAALPSTAVGAVGDLAEHAISRGVSALAGDEASSVAANLVRQGLIKGGRFGAEGGVIGAAQAAGDEALNEHPDLTAEKIWTGFGSGALLGGVTGGLLSGAGELGSRALGSVARRLDNSAEAQATRSLMISSDARGMRNIAKFASEEAGVPGSGIEAIGRHGLEEGIVQAGSNVDDMLPRAQASVQKRGQEVGDITRYADENLPHIEAKNMVRKILDLKNSLDPHLDQAEISKLDQTLRSLAHRNGLPEEAFLETAEKGPKFGSFQDFSQWLAGDEGQKEWAKFRDGVRDGEVSTKQMATAMEDMGKGEIPTYFRKMESSEGLPAAITDAKISYSDARAFRQKLESKVNYEKAINGAPTPAGDILKKARAIIEDEVEKTIEGHDPELAKRYLAAKENYAKSITIQNVLEEASMRRARNAFFSPTDKFLGGITGGAGAIMAGHFSPLAAAAGFASATAAKLLRERGNATAAVALDRLSTMHALQRMSEQTDRAIRTLVRTAVAGESYEHTHRMPMPAGYEAKRSAIIEAAKDPASFVDRVDTHIAPLALNHPTVAQSYKSIAANAANYLHSQVPQNETEDPNSLTPKLDKKEIQPEQKDHFDRVVDAVTNPLGTIAKIHSGTLLPDEVTAIKATSPRMYEQIAESLRTELRTATKPIPYKVESSIRMFLGLPIVSPALATMIATAPTATPAPSGKAGHKGTSKAPKETKIDFSKTLGLKN